MNKSTFYHIADIIQEYRSWIEVIDTKRFIEMNIIQDGMLRPLQFQAITLRSTHEHYSFKQSRIWNINEYDLSHALNKLCEKDPTARERAEQLKLTLEDVEYIIEKASFGIIKLELYNYDY